MSSNRPFGKTWWGTKWVEALERIDYDTNRLPRGRTYARNGSVREIEIRGGDVFAKVQGRRPKPYNIIIRLKRFSNPEIKKITETIASNPAVASELSIGTLPEMLLEILNEQSVYLLPKRWSEIEASCSCPDWANPCKHLAAVYYIISNEIDKAPFILFNLRGIATETLIESAGMTHSNEHRAQDHFVPYEKLGQAADPAGAALLPTSDTTSSRRTVKPTRPRKHFEKKDTAAFIGVAESDQKGITAPAVEGKDDKRFVEEPDFSFQPLDINSLFSILPSSPLFYPYGDFKKLLLRIYKNVADGIEDIEVIEDVPSFEGTEFYLLFRDEKVSSFIFPQQDYFKKGTKTSDTIPLVSEARISLKKVSGTMTAFDSLIELLLHLPLDTGSNGVTPSFRFLNTATSVALAIIRSSSFVPEVILKDNGCFKIRYVPLSSDEKVENAMDYLKFIMPVNLGFRKKDKALLTQDGVYDVVSMIVTHVVHRYADVNMGDKVANAFFSANAHDPAGFEERQTGKSVSDWLERLSVRKRDISPVIRIETLKDTRFSIHIDVENKRDPLSPIIPLSRLFEGEGTVFSSSTEVVRTDVSRQIAVAGEYMPPLRDVLNGKGKRAATIRSDEMANFMEHTSSILNHLGIRVIIPKALKELVVPRLALRASAKTQITSYLSIDQLLDFSWEIAVGDTTISKSEFLKLVKSAEGIVSFKNQYLLLTPDEMKGILDKLNKPLPRPSSMEVLRSAFTGEMNGVMFNPDDAIKKVLDDITNVKEIDVPPTLNGTLRPYQERGFRWLYSNTTKGFGSCIADDMGLGKTIQVIALILKLREDRKLSGPVLVICPTTLIGNWHKECERFAPSLSVSVYHGTERHFDTEDVDVVVTSYGVLRRDVGLFTEREWDLVVIDEAQNIKNHETDQTRAVKSLKAKSCVAMSGTPVENRLAELWSVFDFTNRGYLEEMGAFQKAYTNPIEKYRDRERIEKLRLATGPFILRRLKSDRTIITDLPDKVISDEYCYLTKEQASLYERVVDTVMKEIEESEGIERRGMIFKLITALKQICNHPVHYSKKGKPAKELSGKAERCVEILERIVAAREKVLIFTQYVEMGKLLVEILKHEIKEKPLFLYGGLPRTKRDKMVEEFQTNDSHKIMLLSLKAGGTGLNLTSATNVIHYDLWWNSAVETQATDRTYRIGQTKNVMVHRLITLGTFEEKIDEMMRAKRELAELTVATGEKWITELSNKELKEIFNLVPEALSGRKAG